jgi:hypothetical protein
MHLQRSQIGRSTLRGKVRSTVRCRARCTIAVTRIGGCRSGTSITVTRVGRCGRGTSITVARIRGYGRGTSIAVTWIGRCGRGTSIAVTRIGGCRSGTSITVTRRSRSRGSVAITVTTGSRCRVSRPRRRVVRVGALGRRRRRGLRWCGEGKDLALQLIQIRGVPDGIRGAERRADAGVVATPLFGTAAAECGNVIQVLVGGNVRKAIDVGRRRRRRTGAITVTGLCRRSGVTGGGRGRSVTVAGRRRGAVAISRRRSKGRQTRRVTAGDLVQVGRHGQGKAMHFER